MSNEISDWESMSPQEKADILKGGLSYKEHYNYLMDWYMKDRKVVIPQAEMHESLKDVLEALKELNAKVNSNVAEAPSKQRAKGSLFTRLIENY